MTNPSQIISTILKHESKRNTYKIALVRAINDIALEYPYISQHADGVAIPLRMIAEFWLAYYWAFVDSNNPILQGHNKTDMAFRPMLTKFRLAWENNGGESSPAEGYVIKNVFAIKRKQAQYKTDLLKAYHQVIRKIQDAIQQPIKYAGTGEYNLFDAPKPLSALSHVIPIPIAEPNDVCLVVPMDLWVTFQEMSLWIEALCIHEWCMFTETVTQEDGGTHYRGMTYGFLTKRPDNRRPLTWERNQIDILLMEGATFQCPWTHKIIKNGVEYDLDHLIPIAVRPMNELWNLVPADKKFNSHIKRDRLPSEDALLKAEQPLINTYVLYQNSRILEQPLYEDSQARFGLKPSNQFAEELARLTCNFIQFITKVRNVAQF